MLKVLKVLKVDGAGSTEHQIPKQVSYLLLGTCYLELVFKEPRLTLPLRGRHLTIAWS
jgi:hypothetical protein